MFGAIFSKLGKCLAQSTAKASIIAAKKAPDILFWGGVTCVVGGTVVAIAKTDKFSEALDTYHDRKQRIEDKEAKANESDNPEAEYPMVVRKNDKKVIFGSLVMSMAKIYLPVIILETCGVMMLCKSKAILNSRNAALASAYAALSKSYSDYRKRVRDRYGEDVENDIYNGYVTTTYKEVETSENGVTTEKEVSRVDYNPLSPFSFLISPDEQCIAKGYRDPYTIVKQIEIIASGLNQVLDARKRCCLPGERPCLTLREVKEAYGVKNITNTDNTWLIYDYLDFGIDFERDDRNPKSALYKFLNKITTGLWLCPNVGGNICDDVSIQIRNAGIKKLLQEADEKWKVNATT